MDNFTAHAGPDPAAHRWGPDPRLRWVCLAVAVGCLAWRLIDHDPENRLVATTLSVAGLAGMLILLRIRVRLRADSSGLTITGPLHVRSVAWSDIVMIATPQRGRFGRRRAALEIDVRRGEPSDEDDDSPGTAVHGDADGGSHPAADTDLLAFGAFELGTDPAAVGRALGRLRP